MITISRKKSTPELAPVELKGFDRDEYEAFNLEDYFEQTLVTECLVHNRAIDEINQFVKESCIASTVPEVGGFLVGNRAYENKKKKYTTICEFFLPARNVVENTPNRIEFGAQPLVELDKFLDENDDYELVGWFHTHPGHSPFLSNIDVNKIHNILFTKPYQLAVVLDPLMPNWESGVFSWKEEGLLNTSIAPTKWKRWKAIGS